MISISFSGVDGTGKSTQIKMLEKHLWLEKKTVNCYHLFSPGNSAMGKLHTTVIGDLFLRNIRKLLKYGSIGLFIIFLCRAVNVMLDAFITTHRNRKKKVDVIIYDRYFFDVIASVCLGTTISFAINHTRVWVCARRSRNCCITSCGS